MPSRLVVSSLVVLTLLGSACIDEAEIDRAAGHAHDLIDHGYDRHEQLFDHVFARMQAFEPEGFGRGTCTLTSSPSGAEVFERDFFGDWQYVGKTPLIVERDAFDSVPIEVRLRGYAVAEGHMLSDKVRGPCEEHFELSLLVR